MIFEDTLKKKPDFISTHRKSVWNITSPKVNFLDVTLFKSVLQLCTSVFKGTAKTA